MAKKGRSGMGQPKSKKPAKPTKHKHQKGSLGKQKGGKFHGPTQRKQKHYSAENAAQDDDTQERQQRIRDLRQSLGMETGSHPDDVNGDEIFYGKEPRGADVEGLGHLLKAAKRGQISILSDEESGSDAKKRRAGAADSGPRKKRRSADSDTHSDDSSDEEDNEEPEYEQTPRSFPVVRDLLPIKTKAGVVQRKMVVPEKEVPMAIADDASAEEDSTADADDASAEQQLPAAEETVKSVATLYVERRARIDAAKLRIGLLSRAVIEAPQEKYDNLHRLHELLCESDPTVMVTVRKYAAASLLEVFKDVLPSYRIEEHDLTQKLKKETIAEYKYENGLLSAYKKFLIKLEEYSKLMSSKQTTLRGLARFCLDMLCQCLQRFRDFNFASNLVSALVPHTSHADDGARAAVCATIRTVFAEDKSAEITLEIVRRLHALIKAKQWDCRRDITDLFLALRIRHANLDRERQEEAKAKKFMTYKEKLKNMSRNERKRSKKLEGLERELLATHAQENQDLKQKRHSEILTVVFTVYFKILKQLPRSGLMASVLEGLAKFAHMINVDFFHDLVESFHLLLAGGTLTSTRQVLLCVQTVFIMLTGQGEVINIDPQRFYAHAYRALNGLSLDDSSDELQLALTTLELMLIRRRKKVSPQRVLSFAKRLSAVALRAPHPAAAAALVMLRGVSMAHNVTARLLDTESVASGLYRPELEDPEYCGAGSSLLYELTTLRRSYHQPVRSLAAHLMLSCPAQGDFSLPNALRRQSAVDVLETYSTREMRFTPAVTPPSVLKKRATKKRRAAAQSDWLTEQMAATEAAETDTVDWTELLTRTVS